MKSNLILNKKNILIIGTLTILFGICAFNNDGYFKFHDENSKFSERDNSKFRNCKNLTCLLNYISR